MREFVKKASLAAPTVYELASGASIAYKRAGNWDKGRARAAREGADHVIALGAGQLEA
jgi:hypothetical protein